MNNRWEPTLRDGTAEQVINSAETFRDVVIKIACDASQRNLASQTDPYEAKAAMLADRELRLSLALGLHGLWERNFQHLINHWAVVTKNLEWVTENRKRWLCSVWETQKTVFLDVRGMPFSGLHCAESIDLLHLIGNVARHGNGRSCATLFSRRPDLFANTQVSDWHDYFLKGARPHSDAENLDVTATLLADLSNAVISFWQWVLTERSKFG